MATSEHINNYSCNFCGSIISNIAKHFIMDCQLVSVQRNEMWDDLYANLNISTCAALWNQDDFDIYSCLIGS